ncbi:MAG: tRNA (adenosine(37)-N6)-dimethylallyltransferase MiaA [Cyanobacteriota bacterium]
MNKKIPLVIIAGPTGIGKSYLGMEIAKKLSIPIISADSRQIYKDFNIGTAKPSLEEQKEVKHYMIDICEPTRTYTVSEYATEAKNIIEKIYEDGFIPMIVGGTGLYIKTIIQAYSMAEIPPLPEFREKMKLEAETKGNLFLYEKAMEIDPIATEKIHYNDLFRVIRVLEVFESKGEKLSSLQKKSSSPVYDITYIGLNIERENLYKRISDRVEKMFEMGLLDEIKFIMDKYGKDLPLLKTINYSEPKEFLLGNCSLDDSKELMKKNTRNFAKRQLTWFRNDPFINWHEVEKIEDFLPIIEYVSSKF